MTVEWWPETPDRQLALSAGAFLILLLFILFAGAERRRAAGGIRLAAPTFIPLAPNAATHLAKELGAAVGELLDAERRRGES